MFTWDTFHSRMELGLNYEETSVTAHRESALLQSGDLRQDPNGHITDKSSLTKIRVQRDNFQFLKLHVLKS